LLGPRNHLGNRRIRETLPEETSGLDYMHGCMLGMEFNPVAADMRVFSMICCDLIHSYILATEFNPIAATMRVVSHPLGLCAWLNAWYGVNFIAADMRVFSTIHDYQSRDYHGTDYQRREYHS
jgi:hypothetical protein